MFPQIFGKYVLEREIAAGGMARVYLATLRGAVGFEKRLVVKQIRTELASDEAFVTRFVEEAKTAVELSHPNIVPVYELGVEQGVYYIAMELCEGLTLSEVLAETGPLDPEEGAYVGAEICRALDYAHRRVRIVHRDVTPRNVLIDDEGAVRLIDFGIAAPVTRDASKRSEVFGSPGHMPPEQLHGAELTPATDVFAVGVLLIEAWTGYPPFRRATEQESERALFTTPPRIDRNEPRLAPLVAVIQSAVALDPRDRPGLAEQLARPLREFVRNEDSGDIARRLAARVRRARRRSRSSTPFVVGETGGTDHSAKTRPVSDEVPLPVTPTASAPVTRTFAARDDLEVWTRKIESGPSEDSGPSAARDSNPELPVTPMMAAALPLDPGAAALPEPASSTAGTGARSAASAWLGALAAVAFISTAFVFAPAQPSKSDHRPVFSAPVAAAPPLAPSAASVGHELSGPVPMATQPSRPLATHSAEPAHPSLRALASAELEAPGVLKVTADPRAAVELNGAQLHETRQTPVTGWKVPPGRYQLVFRNDTFGAPLTAQVVVVAGANRSVHADFRQAEPTVSVH